METLSTTVIDCGHSQAAMRLSVELVERIADKTVPKMMRGAGVDCGIRHRVLLLRRRAVGEDGHGRHRAQAALR